jgi:hypothetical protein
MVSKRLCGDLKCRFAKREKDLVDYFSEIV